VSKAAALPAQGGLGGRVPRSDRAGVGGKKDGFAELGNVKWVDCYNHRG